MSQPTHPAEGQPTRVVPAAPQAEPLPAPQPMPSGPLGPLDPGQVRPASIAQSLPVQRRTWAGPGNSPMVERIRVDRPTVIVPVFGSAASGPGILSLQGWYSPWLPTDEAANADIVGFTAPRARVYLPAPGDWWVYFLPDTGANPHDVTLSCNLYDASDTAIRDQILYPRGGGWQTIDTTLNAATEAFIVGGTSPSIAFAFLTQLRVIGVMLENAGNNGLRVTLDGTVASATNGVNINPRETSGDPTRLPQFLQLGRDELGLCAIRAFSNLGSSLRTSLLLERLD